ncbi:MAG: hypothetical protein M0025_13365 [Elusimicrobia bacterium]|nr:hypothetical protein [Elusimicrobiota bacterium]
MLKEIRNLMQAKGEPRRRWFDDEYFDLIVWLEPDGSFFGFQLCYDRERKPRALTWTKKYGYKHTGIDTGEHVWGTSKEAPVLVDDGLFDAPSVGKRFAEAAAGIPSDISAFVSAKLREFRL